MCSSDLATPESGIVDANLLFGADSFSAVNPSVYPVSTLRNLLIGGGSVAVTAGKTFTVTETMTLTALGSSQTYTFPALGGTVALLNAANIFSNATNTFGVQGTTRGGVVLANTNGATNNLTLYSSNSNASAWSLTFPVGPGTNHYVLTTDGAGVSSWAQVDLANGVTGTPTSQATCQALIGVVHRELIAVMGEADAQLNLATTPPAVILMAGLQGSGKTTTTAKLARRLTDRAKRKVLMASLDVKRPAAQEQLAVLGRQIGIDTLPIVAGQTPVQIARRAEEAAQIGRAHV